MDHQPSPVTIGLLAVAISLILVAAAWAGGAWVQAYSTRLIARHAFKRQLRGGLWKLYFFLAVPLSLLAAMLEGVGWPLLAILVLFLGAAPLIRHFIRCAPQNAEDGDAWTVPNWGECLGLSAGSALAVCVPVAALMVVANAVGLGVLVAAMQ